MPEEIPPIGESVDEVLARRLPPESVEEYDRLKKEYREICRSVRRRHKGEAREAMLRYEAEVFRQKVQGLLKGLTG